MIQNMKREREKTENVLFLSLNIVADLCYKCSQLAQRWRGGGAAAAARGAGGLH